MADARGIGGGVNRDNGAHDVLRGRGRGNRGLRGRRVGRGGGGVNRNDANRAFVGNAVGNAIAEIAAQHDARVEIAAPELAPHPVDETILPSGARQTEEYRRAPSTEDSVPDEAADDETMSMIFRTNAGDFDGNALRVPLMSVLRTAWQIVRRVLCFVCSLASITITVVYAAVAATDVALLIQGPSHQLVVLRLVIMTAVFTLLSCLVRWVRGRLGPEQALLDGQLANKIADFEADSILFGRVNAVRRMVRWSRGQGAFQPAYRGRWLSMFPAFLQTGFYYGARVLLNVTKHDVRILRDRGPVTDLRSPLREIAYSTDGLLFHRRVVADAVLKSVAGRFASMRAIPDAGQVGVQVDKELMNVNLHESCHASVAAATTEAVIALLVITGKW